MAENEQLQPEQTPAAEEVAAQAAESVEVDLRAELETLRQQLQEEQRKAAEHYDSYLRSVAELRNYKKRVEQEREQLSREANAELILRLLPILDDLERAFAVLPDEKLLRFSWIEGILLIYRRLQAVLEQHGLRPIEAVGKPFDPYLHEAILFQEVPPEQDQLVLSELQRGYKLYDRVLRPTLVKVGRAPEAPAEPPAPPKTEPQEKDEVQGGAAPCRE
ncbi:MAG: nucleotide exchange factor GrpE [Chloroflexia bacterium]